jgi:hypothetical protein
MDMDGNFFIFYFINFINHMGCQMKGGEMKGSEARVVFTAMDGPWG